MFFQTQARRAAEETGAGRAIREELGNKLAWLWDTVANPVLRDAGIHGTPAPSTAVPRMTWCPIGPMVFLPLHAAGHHTDITEEEEPRTVIDRAESTYLPKLSILLHRQHGPSPLRGTSRPPLIVSRPLAPGRPTTTSQGEAEHLLTLFPDATHLYDSVATKEAVLAGLRSHTWFHFSLHGATDNATPTRSWLELHDARLTIQDLSTLDLTGAVFAFLSACDTYRGAPALPDESITLGAALSISGCQHVIATLWPVRVSHAVQLTQRFYNKIVTTNETGSRLHPQDSPSALRDAARILRDEHPGSRPRSGVNDLDAGCRG